MRRPLAAHADQAPPLVTATGALLDLANSQSFTFSPLKGERDIEWQYGVTIPFHGWQPQRRFTLGTSAGSAEGCPGFDLGPGNSLNSPPETAHLH